MAVDLLSRSHRFQLFHPDTHDLFVGNADAPNASIDSLTKRATK